MAKNYTMLESAKIATPARNARVVETNPQDSLVPTDSLTNKPKDEMHDLANWVMTRVKQWRDHRRMNYEIIWDQYERLWRGLWTPEDKNRKSERSTLITPGLAEAVENIVAEVEEAVFGRGDFFDMKASFKDGDDARKIIDDNKALLKEDLTRSDFTPNIGEVLINAAVYGSGIGEILIETFQMREIAASVQAAMPQPGMPPVPPTAQVISKEVNYACMQSVSPRNFLIDPTARTVDKAVGCAVEEYVGAHIINQGQKDGKYRDVDLTTDSGDTEIVPDRQVISEYMFDKIKIIRYYGLVPRKLLFPPNQTADLFPAEEGEQLGIEIHKQEDLKDQAELAKDPDSKDDEDSEEVIDANMVEAVVVIANDAVCLKAVENPYLMKDRPVMAFPWDIVPGRFWGRGVCEKGIVPQKVMDAELRARVDALAYVSAPMMAMDASRLPRGFQLTVRPGKSILTNGDPSTILKPMHFGQLEQSTFTHSQQLDQMIQRATGSLDVIALAQKSGERPGAVSMMLSGIVKRHKRTLMSFIDRFFVPCLRKMMWRNMQFCPERYTPRNWNFVSSSTMGILQREYETTNLIQLMNTMEPQSKEYKMLLMGVIANTGLTHRQEIIDMLKQGIATAQQMEQAQAQMAQQQMQTGAPAAGATPEDPMVTQAKVAELASRTALQNAKAANAAQEPQFRQMEIATKGIYQVGAQQQQSEFDRRMAVEDRLLKRAEIAKDIHVVNTQTAASLASEKVKASAQPPKQPIPVPVPIPHPIPVAVPHFHPTASTFGAPHPIIRPFGVQPLVASNARVMP